MRYHFTYSNPFMSISTYGDEYNTFEPEIKLLVSENASFSQEYVASLQNLFPGLSPSVVRCDPGATPQYCLEFKGNVLRDVVNQLFQIESITAIDRASIENEIVAFEKSMERRLSISDVMSPAQKERIEMIVSSYIDFIFDEIPDLTLALNVCDIGLCDIPVSSDVSPLLISNYMRKNGIKDQFDASISDPKIKNEIFDCIWQLWRIYSRAENLKIHG